MNFSKLTWDSEFFGLNIGKIVLSQDDDFSNFDVKSYQDYDLIYIYAPHRYDVHLCDVKLVDNKVFYRKNIINKGSVNSNICAFTGKEPSHELYDLALQSGEYSRFKFDKRFPIGSYENLYRRWVEQSVCKTIADDVLCYYSEGRIVGMVTISAKEGIGRIGLVAVDTSSRNIGVGSALLDAVNAYFFERRIYIIDVPTQLNNTKACNWYEKNGYKVSSITDIYHWWID